MYMISKDEYESLHQKSQVCSTDTPSTGDITDSQVNNIDVSHGGTITINPSNEVGKKVSCSSSHPSSSSSSSSSPSSTSTVERIQHLRERGRPRQKRENVPRQRRENGGDTPPVTVVTNTSSSSSTEGQSPTDGGRFYRREPTTDGEGGRVASVPPPPTDLRRRASLNAAAIAQREKVMLQQLVEERLDRLQGRRRRRDPHGSERELLHQLRDVNQAMEGGKRRKISYEGGGGAATVQRQDSPAPDPPAVPIAAVGRPTLNPARKRSRRLLHAQRQSVFNPGRLVPETTPSPSTVKRNASWERMDQAEEWERRKRSRISNYLDRHIAGKKRPAFQSTLQLEGRYTGDPTKRRRKGFSPPRRLAGKKHRASDDVIDWEGEFRKRGRIGRSPPRQFAGVKRRAEEGYLEQDPFHYEPLEKRQNTNYAPVRHVGTIAGVKRKKTEDDWDQAEYDDRDVLPPSKRMPEYE